MRELKGGYVIPIADVFIAANAHLERSIVISDDAEFKWLHEMKTLAEKGLASRLPR
ncbi:hypothetical protein KEJ39_01475 [Candidatus Bathyarchaeota archaeon]|nr:hypothetical protein [Candidatus Bathyarchaeota archaeon]